MRVCSVCVPLGLIPGEKLTAEAAKASESRSNPYSAQAQIPLTQIRARAELVKARTALVNSARGLVKWYGERLGRCHTQQVGQELANGLSRELREAQEPLWREVESLNAQIKEYDRRIEKMARETYPEVERLKQVKGVGDLIALT